MSNLPGNTQDSNANVSMRSSRPMLHGQDPHTPPPVPELCSLSPGPQVVIRWVTGAGWQGELLIGAEESPEAVGGVLRTPVKGLLHIFS